MKKYLLFLLTLFIACILLYLHMSRCIIVPCSDSAYKLDRITGKVTWLHFMREWDVRKHQPKQPKELESKDNDIGFIPDNPDVVKDSFEPIN